MFLGLAYRHNAIRANAPMGIRACGHVRIWAHGLWNPASRSTNGDSDMLLQRKPNKESCLEESQQWVYGHMGIRPYERLGIWPYGMPHVEVSAEIPFCRTLTRKQGIQEAQQWAWTQAMCLWAYGHVGTSAYGHKGIWDLLHTTSIKIHLCRRRHRESHI